MAVDHRPTIASGDFKTHRPRLQAMLIELMQCSLISIRHENVRGDRNDMHFVKVLVGSFGPPESVGDPIHVICGGHF